MVQTPTRNGFVNGQDAVVPILQSSRLPKTALFGTDGIRGRVGDFLNAELALQAGFWAGEALKGLAGAPGPVVLGRDSRNSSDMLAIALSAGLMAAGLEVWDLGLCPTPCVASLTNATDAVGGVMISASHNPPGDNGIKFFGADGTKLPSSVQAQIEAGIRGHLEATAVMKWGRQYQRPELVGDYTASLQQQVEEEVGTNEPLSGMRIVLDLAWGAACSVAPDVFRRLGAEVICLHDRPDGDRINVNCGSTHLHSLQTAVQELKADMGFAFDGDADRTLAVDNQGRPVDGDYILYLWGKALMQAQKLPGNTLIATVMSNLGFERAWTGIGGTFVRTSVGDQYVHAEMLRRGAMLGGEQSGHVICRHYGISGDGTMTALHLAAAVLNGGTTLAELRDRSFQTYPQLLRNVRVEDRDRRLNWSNSEPLQAAISRAEAEMGDRGRILVRASGTEPLIRVMVEAATDELAQYWTENLVLAVQQHL
ncbi:MAG TPA: phosphoglucosamine mutase [Oscillatoriaceae cyanobacterium M33_DOE_052]|uniref:Phosphoglucosamine mutase n=1 Tax=Planktothricoides sp. SpSt-374 TaxID=2282167 RepID=A0A7C3ZIN4_9CYAN|nr:phosphoglucosamine mutase [Oscillatoriaceae cyanobacterium M33_DOE_052]